MGRGVGVRWTLPPCRAHRRTGFRCSRGRGKRDSRRRRRGVGRPTHRDGVRNVTLALAYIVLLL
ncbi:hypothetical protein RHRU231_800095 [Rhodococcus ruber]|uniref:Uncharacterized protein n=1 Tax=Rhodococcus ruber TaxID=1830 RepID=A0A098BR26_9NOCA|nr:hypothetical protein RHRU231_800095 [Rhodococcus ruber]